MKLKNILNRIPRPVKTCVCGLLVILLATTYYIALGCPTLTLKQEFRRAERAHMVGPSKIVDTLHEGQYDEFSKLFVGETEYGICFFGRYYSQHPYNNPFAEKLHMLSYVEKTGDITVAPAPNIYGGFWNLKGATLPVYVFTSKENAARAEIEITVQGEMSNPDPNYSYNVFYNETIKAESTRKISGAFRFMLKGSTNTESHALAQFSTIYSNSLSVPLVETNFPIPVIVRLYDSNNKLIAEEQFTMGS